MKRVITSAVVVAGFFSWTGWGLAQGGGVERDKGHLYAHEKHQKEFEDIKRTQGDETGGRNLHSYFSVQT